MGSDIYYKIWLWNAGSWSEVTRFTHLSFSDGLNFVPIMSATLYLTNSTQQGLMKAGTVFRITTAGSTNGFVNFTHDGVDVSATEAGSGWEIMTGFLGEPKGESKTAVINATPVIYSVVGEGMLGRVATMEYNDDRNLTGTAAQIVSTGANSYLTTVGTGTVLPGTIDTGPSGLSVRAKHDNLLGLLLDVASLGDGTNLFTYYIDAVPNNAATGDFIPRVHYVAPNNAKYETTNPLGGVDNGRVLDRSTEVLGMMLVKERDRIKNAVDVRYAGAGTGTVQAATGYSTDATSITNFKRMEKIVLAPWAQNSVTATFLRNTVLDMFKGTGSDGIVRADAIIKNGQLFTNSSFDAILGDTVSIRTDSADVTGVITGKFMAYSYDQMSRTLTVTVGIPRVPTIEEDVAFTKRRLRQLSTNLRSSNSFTPLSITSAYSLTTNAFPSTTIGATTEGLWRYDTFTATNFDSAEKYTCHITFNLSSPPVVDGPIMVQVYSVAAVDPTNYIVLQRLAYHEFVNVRTGTYNSYVGAFDEPVVGASTGPLTSTSGTISTNSYNSARIEFNFSGSGSNTFNSLLVVVSNRGDQSFTTTASGISVNLIASPPHVHTM